MRETVLDAMLKMGIHVIWLWSVGVTKSGGAAPKYNALLLGLMEHFLRRVTHESKRTGHSHETCRRRQGSSSLPWIDVNSSIVWDPLVYAIYVGGHN